MIVKYHQHRLFDHSQPQTLEQVFRRFGSFAGIHTYKFDSLYEHGSVGWSGPQASDTLTATDTQITVIPATGAQYGLAIQETKLPHSHLITASLSSYGGGFVVGYTAFDADHYIIGTDASGHPCLLKGKNGTYTVIAIEPATFTFGATYAVTVNRVSFGDSDSEQWTNFSLWINGKLALTHMQPGAFDVATPLLFGIATIQGRTVTYSGTRIPQMSDFVEWITIDPGETPQGGLARPTEGLYMRYFARWDGSLRAWKPEKYAAVYSLNNGDLAESIRTSFDARGLRNHIRLVGAYTEAEAISRRLLRYGYRFDQVYNPYLMSQYECAVEAERMLIRMEESAHTGEFAMSFTPHLEAEDRIEVDGENDWIINERTIRFTITQAEQTISARKYLRALRWGEFVWDDGSVWE